MPEGNDPTRHKAEEQYADYAIMRASRDALARELTALSAERDRLMDLLRVADGLREESARQHREDIDRAADQCTEYQTIAAKLRRAILVLIESVDDAIGPLTEALQQTFRPGDREGARLGLLTLVNAIDTARKAIQ